MKLYENPLFHIMHIGKVLEQQVTKEMQSSCSVTHADVRLMIIVGYNPQATQKSLADALSVSPAAISRHIDKLEKSLWVKRILNPKSRRESSVILTKKGEKLRDGVLRELEIVLKTILESLPQIAKTTVGDLVRIATALEEKKYCKKDTRGY